MSLKDQIQHSNDMAKGKHGFGSALLRAFSLGSIDPHNPRNKGSKELERVMKTSIHKNAPQERVTAWMDEQHESLTFEVDGEKVTFERSSNRRLFDAYSKSGGKVTDEVIQEAMRSQGEDQ